MRGYDQSCRMLISGRTTMRLRTLPRSSTRLQTSGSNTWRIEGSRTVLTKAMMVSSSRPFWVMG